MISNIMIGDLVRVNKEALTLFSDAPLPNSIGLVTSIDAKVIAWVKWPGLKPRPLNYRWLRRV